MKIRSSIKIALPILLLVSCTDRQTTDAALNPELEQTTILADMLNKFREDNFSMQSAAFLATTYGIDFDREYEKIRPLLEVDHALQTESRGRDVVMNDMVKILERNGIVSGTSVYQYLIEIMDIFDNEQSNSYMITSFDRLKREVLSDRAVSESDKRRLAKTFTLLMSNYNGIANGVSASFQVTSSGRAQSLFGSVWRMVRSIVVTSVIGALIGSTGGLPGAIIGAAVTGAAATADATENHYCHFALQCSGGWRQDCISGECKPYAP